MSRRGPFLFKKWGEKIFKGTKGMGLFSIGGIFFQKKGWNRKGLDGGGSVGWGNYEVYKRWVEEIWRNECKGRRSLV